MGEKTLDLNTCKRKRALVVRNAGLAIWCWEFAGHLDSDDLIQKK
jgi:hypothetical protein